MLNTYKRGATWWIGGQNAHGVVIPRHSTKCKVKGPDGKISPEGKAAAAAYLRKIDTATEWPMPLALQEPEPEPTPALTLTESLERYLVFKRPEHKGTSPRIARWSITSQIIEPLAKLKPPVTTVDQLTQDHFVNLQDGWLDRVEAGTLAFNSLVTFRGQSRAWLQYLVDKDLLARNPWKGMKWPKPEEGGDEVKATMPLDLDDDHANWRKIRESVIPFCEGKILLDGKPGRKRHTNPLWRHPEAFLCFLELMYHTGLRRSDTLRFDPSKLKATEFGNWVYESKQKKTRKPVTVWLEPWLAERIMALPRLSTGLPFYEPELYGGEKEEDYLSHYVAKPLRELGKFIGVPGLRCHRFRDSFAVNWLNAGGSLDDLKELLGHTKLATTERYYAPFVKSRKKAIEQRLCRNRSQSNPAIRLTVVPPAA